jgi:hypothetical protein
MSGKFEAWMHCRQTRNSRTVLFETVNQDIYKLCYNVHPTAFDVVASSCAQQESDSSYTKMSRRVRHYPSKNVRQYVRSLNYCMRHILQICHLAICSYSHDCNENWKTIVMRTVESFRWPWRNNSATFQCFPRLLHRPPETLEEVRLCRSYF